MDAGVGVAGPWRQDVHVGNVAWAAGIDWSGAGRRRRAIDLLNRHFWHIDIDLQELARRMRPCSR